MHAIILAGGEGTRLRPLTDDKPKPMVEIDGVPMLEHQLRQLDKAGINDIVVCESYRADKIQDYFGDGKRFGMNIKHISLPKEINSSGAIKAAIEEVPSDEQNVLVLYGDIISDVDFEALLSQHTSQGALLTAVTIPLKSPYGVWQEDDEGRVTSFQEKPNIETNSGIFAANRGIIPFLTDGEDFFGGTVVPIMNLGGNQRGTGMIQTYRHKGFWRDIADLTNLTDAEAYKDEWMIKSSNSIEGGISSPEQGK